MTIAPITLSESILLAQPEGQAEQLMLLFHGVGAVPRNLAPLGERLAKSYPRAFIVSICAPQASDLGNGYQWFSVQDITEENRVERVAQAMPGFLATIRHWQEETRIGMERTALIGFSQGAIMALESTRDRQPPAGRVLSIAGRFAQLPRETCADTTLYLFHGKDDPVIHYGYTVTAAEHIVALGGDVSADVLPFMRHEITEELIAVLIERLQSHVPLKTWQEVMRIDAPIDVKQKP